MTDARYEAARQTDQSGQRGWDFRPSREPSSSTPALIIGGIVAAVCTVLSLIDMVMGRWG